MSKETLSFVTPPPPKNYKISSAFSYNFKLALTELDGEEVLRVLTNWHGLQILDNGFYGHLVDEGYIEEPEEEEAEDDNCEAGTYDCGSCPLDGVCVQQGTEQMKQAKQTETFEDFCSSFNGCTYCPFDRDLGDCEKDLWPKWKEGRAK